MNDTTRRYPRSLAQAFPQDYADPIEGPEKHRLTIRDLAFIAVAVVAALVGLSLKFAAMVTT